MLNSQSLPVSPSKRVTELQLEQQKSVHASPDMKHARSRLGNLLSGIRKGDLAAPNQPARDFREESYHSGSKASEPEEDEPKKPKGRPRKRRERRVVFELRGKSFSMQNREQVEPVYAMCRRWMYGRDDDPQPPSQSPEPLSDEVSLDLLATKPIYALPGPDTSFDIPGPVPDHLPVREDLTLPRNASDEEQLAIIMADHLQHWRNVKKCFNDYNEVRKQRYRRNIELLKTVYNIAQQTQS